MHGGEGEIGQKSMQRPCFSQSPYRVGSGPDGPPISALSSRLPAADPASSEQIFRVSRRAGPSTVAGCMELSPVPDGSVCTAVPEVSPDPAADGFIRFRGETRDI